jgi:hypothetical protein
MPPHHGRLARGGLSGTSRKIVCAESIFVIESELSRRERASGYDSAIWSWVFFSEVSDRGRLRRSDVVGSRVRSSMLTAFLERSYLMDPVSPAR